MDCHMCGGTMVKKEITHHTMYRGKLIVVENVPVRECTQCAETYFSAAVFGRLEEIVWQQDEPFRLMEVPVFQYAETKAAAEREGEQTIAAGD